MNSLANQTARSAAEQVDELRELRAEQAAETARAVGAEVERRAREIVAEKVETRRYWSMFGLTLASMFFAAVAAVAAVVVLMQ